MSKQLSRYIGVHLQELRAQRNLTQEQVAKLAGTKTNYYSKLERGLVLPSLKLLEKILKGLNASFKDILP